MYQLPSQGSNKPHGWVWILLLLILIGQIPLILGLLFDVLPVSVWTRWIGLLATLCVVDSILAELFRYDQAHHIIHAKHWGKWLFLVAVISCVTIGRELLTLWLEHPDNMWLALFMVVALLGAIALVARSFDR